MIPNIDLTSLEGIAATFGISAFVALLIILLLAAWALAWKGLALWHAARNGEKAWFIALLVINTVGILEIVYLLFFRKNRR